MDVRSRTVLKKKKGFQRPTFDITSYIRSSCTIVDAEIAWFNYG